MSSATIDSAIVARWRAQNLDALFRMFWSDPTDTKFKVFHDQEARGSTPMPYCVYEKGTPVSNGRSTGSECEPENEIEYWTCPVTFKIHCKTPARGEKNFGRSWKDIAVQIVGQSDPDGYGVLKAFDDATGLLTLGGNDRHMDTLTGADYHTREDDDVGVWVLQFDIRFERRRTLRGVP